MDTTVHAINLLSYFPGHFYLPQTEIIFNLVAAVERSKTWFTSCCWYLGLRCMEVVLHELSDQWNVLIVVLFHDGLVIIFVSERAAGAYEWVDDVESAWWQVHGYQEPVRVLHVNRKQDCLTPTQVHLLFLNNTVELLEIVLACESLRVSHIAKLSEEECRESEAVIGVIRRALILRKTVGIQVGWLANLLLLII